MPKFYTLVILLINQSKQFSVFGSRGDQNSPLMHVPLSCSAALRIKKFSNLWARHPPPPPQQPLTIMNSVGKKQKRPIPMGPKRQPLKNFADTTCVHHPSVNQSFRVRLQLCMQLLFNLLNNYSIGKKQYVINESADPMK